ncbi:MAG: hypothetical protein CMH54_00150 [Myxococcales bacterium]|nr:hypothetical protein [Myxococcales bacterium]|tara:strand:- start:1166 stop:1918 length:753 start_codon:yes stop_codon:yes gene_type:complete
MPAFQTMRFFGFVVAALFFVACFEPENEQIETNIVTLSWQVSGGTCATAKIPNVQINVFDEKGDLYDQVVTLCSNGSTTFEEVEEGSYRVQVLGLNEENNATYETPSLDVTVIAGPEPIIIQPPLQLAIRRAHLEITWKFSTGGQCNFEGVDKIEISVWDQVVEMQVAQDTVSCTFDPNEQDMFPDGTMPRGLAIVDLAPGEVLIEGFGLDAQGYRLFHGTEEALKLNPGEIHEIELVLYPCSDEGVSCQ